MQGGKITCPVGSVKPIGVNYGGAAATVTIVVVPRSSGTISNTATVKGDQKDPVSANNKATATTRVLCRRQLPWSSGDDRRDRGRRRTARNPGADVIAALGGNDRIVSEAGRDLICAGSGRDYVGAGTAADTGFGAPGAIASSAWLARTCSRAGAATMC